MHNYVDQLIIEEGVIVDEKWEALNQLLLYSHHLSNDDVEKYLNQKELPENVMILLTADGPGLKKKHLALSNLMMYAKHLDVDGIKKFMNERKM